PWTARTRSATPASAARRVRAASASGLASTPVTSCPACASGTANPPVPPPTSTTVNRRAPTRSRSPRSPAHTPAVRGAECGPGPNRSTAASLEVHLSPGRDELGRLLLQPQIPGGGLVDAVLLGVPAQILRDLHGTELGPAHRAEVRGLGGFRG